MSSTWTHFSLSSLQYQTFRHYKIHSLLFNSCTRVPDAKNRIYPSTTLSLPFSKEKDDLLGNFSSSYPHAIHARVERTSKSRFITKVNSVCYVNKVSRRCPISKKKLKDSLLFSSSYDAAKMMMIL